MTVVLVIIAVAFVGFLALGIISSISQENNSKSSSSYSPSYSNSYTNNYTNTTNTSSYESD